MRRILALILAALPLAACNHDGGPEIASGGHGGSRSYQAEGFTAVALAGPDDVKVTVGPAFSVRAEGDERLLDELRIVKDGDTLRIGRRRGVSSLASYGTARIFVAMPRIAAADLAGSGDLSVDRVEGAGMAATVSGSGNVTLGDVKVARAAMSIAGSGNVHATGAAETLAVEIAGSGNVDAGRLEAKSATVSIAGSGGVTAKVDGPAAVRMMGSGDVDLGPKARCTVSKMGSGSVTCGG